MIPASFRYQRAQTVAEALALLSTSSGETKIIAGGHSLLPLMKLRLARPEMVIDIGRIRELDGIVVGDDAVTIKAATRYREVEAHPEIRRAFGGLVETIGQIADPQVRNRGTLGGSVAHADPSADLPAFLLAAEATCRVMSAEAERTVRIDEWFMAPLVSALTEREILWAIELPRKLPAKQTYLKFPHPASGYALAGVAALWDQTPEGRIERVRIGVTGAGTLPFRATGAEALLTGQVITPETIRQAAVRGAEDGQYASDVFYSAEYRRHLATVMIERALQKLME